MFFRIQVTIAIRKSVYVSAIAPIEASKLSSTEIGAGIRAHEGKRGKGKELVRPTTSTESLSEKFEARLRS